MEVLMDRKTGWMWLLVLVLVALVALYMGGFVGGGAKGKTEYQAVFLSNGQVYFGKVSGGKDTVTVKDIYYLRVQQAVQPKAEDEKAQPQVSLVKLGNEIHGPTDEMRINADHILFVEDLKADGKVVTAIKNFQANGSTDTTSVDQKQ